MFVITSYSIHYTKLYEEKYVSNGGPDGGDGGAGGNIIFIATRDMRTLADFRYKRHYKAERGQDGSSSNCTGRGGENLIIKVPCGTIIKEKNRITSYNVCYTKLLRY